MISDLIFGFMILLIIMILILIFIKLTDVIEHFENLTKLMKNFSYQMKNITNKKTLDVNEISVSGKITADQVIVDHAYLNSSVSSGDSNSLPKSENSDSLYVSYDADSVQDSSSSHKTGVF